MDINIYSASIPIFLHRIERCNANDIAWMKDKIQKIFPTFPPTADNYIVNNFMLRKFLILNDFWDSDFDPTIDGNQYYGDILQLKGTFLSSGIIYPTLYDLYNSSWPRFISDISKLNYSRFGRTNNPVLIFNAGLDTYTSNSSAYFAKSKFNNSKIISFPTSPRGCLLNTQYKVDGNLKDTCAKKIFLQFIHGNNLLNLDDTCVNEVINTMSTTENLAIFYEFFGTDLWGDTPIVMIIAFSSIALVLFIITILIIVYQNKIKPGMAKEYKKM